LILLVQNDFSFALGFSYPANGAKGEIHRRQHGLAEILFLSHHVEDGEGKHINCQGVPGKEKPFLARPLGAWLRCACHNLGNHSKPRRSAHSFALAIAIRIAIPSS
jgi:hypothetical protein